MGIRVKVIVRDVVAIWKAIPELIVSAIDDWADKMMDKRP